MLRGRLQDCRSSGYRCGCPGITLWLAAALPVPFLSEILLRMPLCRILCICHRGMGRSLRLLPLFGSRHQRSLREAPKGTTACLLDGGAPTLGSARTPASGLTNGTAAAAPHLSLGLYRACVFFDRDRRKWLGFHGARPGARFCFPEILAEPSDWDGSWTMFQTEFRPIWVNKSIAQFFTKAWHSS
jgi:hypothetical protein